MAVGAAAVLGAIVAVLRATPWPAVLVIRRVFEKGARVTLAEMAPYVPDVGFIEHRDVEYGDAGFTTTLDVFDVGGRTKPAPAVVWIHGGAWISGSKSDVEPYLKILAADGHVTVGLDYTIAPEAVYPVALTQLNRALGYLVEHAAELGIDPTRIVLAGDSAGAQLASQLAVLITNPRYARLVGVVPSLEPSQLAGVVLHCGLYDLPAMASATGIVGWGFKTALWAYTGHKNWSETPAGATMSTIDFVTGDLPPVWLSGGNGDGLTHIQSVPLAERMRAAGVDVTALFWAADHQPALPHEYQFHLDFEEAQEALDRTREFLTRVTAPSAAPPGPTPPSPTE
ncbi:alpha/beta hydrolase [Herbiconiux sp. CPCC 205763]|uniref:Alpha/beta hydrolase n=1 Tax=Herbiconiux aconitum TaxID=2970913 RepID=A0ABT2GSU2_9MICO|nr:alpha/beta hydrolase [Herbiconiux aconitum]MCS5718637.1 alpha/beta hydrolase [Herbiconiux aconitum]